MNSKSEHICLLCGRITTSRSQICRKHNKDIDKNWSEVDQNRIEGYENERRGHCSLDLTTRMWENDNEDTSEQKMVKF